MAFAVDAGAARVRSRVSFEAPLEPRPFPELDCVRTRLAADVLHAAEARAGAFGTGADRVLISSGALDEETYLRALGESLGVTFEPLDGVPRCRAIVRRMTASVPFSPLAVATYTASSLVVIGPLASAAAQSRHGARHALRHQCRHRLSHIGFPRLVGTDAARPFIDRLGVVADAAALAVAVAVACGLARALSAHRRALHLGEDRARAGHELAAQRRHDALALAARAPSHRA